MTLFGQMCQKNSYYLSLKLTLIFYFVQFLLIIFLVFVIVAIGYTLILCLRPLQENLITHVLPLSSPPLFVLSARDRAVPARLAFFHDHGGQFCGVGWSAADAWSGIPLPWLAGPPSCHHLPPPAYAVLHLVRKRPEHLLHFSVLLKNVLFWSSLKCVFQFKFSMRPSTVEICGAICDKTLRVRS